MYLLFILVQPFLLPYLMFFLEANEEASSRQFTLTRRVSQHNCAHPFTLRALHNI